MLTFVGDYNHSSALDIEVFNNSGTPGIGHDPFVVDGDLSLNRWINVSIRGGFVPDPNDVFVIATLTQPILGTFICG